MEQSVLSDTRFHQLLTFHVPFALFTSAGDLAYASPAAVATCGDPRGGGGPGARRRAWSILAGLAAAELRPADPASGAFLVEGTHGRCRATVHATDATAVGAGILVVLHPHPVDDVADLSRFELTPREDEVMRLLAMGLPLKQVAGRLGVSYHTARHHAENIYAKLGVHGRVEAVRVVMGAA